MWPAPPDFPEQVGTPAATEKATELRKVRKGGDVRQIHKRCSLFIDQEQ